MMGFKAHVVEGLELGAAQNLRRTFALEVGGLAEQVTVTSESPLINTVAPEQRQAYSQLQIKELPLARRNITALVGEGTGVTTIGGGILLNGVGRSGTRISVDGTEASSNPETSATAMHGNFTYIGVMSIEMIQEVQTTKGIIPAEYSSTLVGNVNIITRSGTNDWHGSLFENYQAAALNAREQTQRAKPPLTFNQFGGSIGGPIRRDKIFIFGGYEGYRESAAPPSQADVPTARLRGQMIAAVPDYKYYLDFFPLPNQPHDLNGELGRFVGAGRLIARENQVNLKGDILLFGNSTLAVSYTRGRPYRSLVDFTLTNPAIHNAKSERVTTSFVMGHPSWTSESRFGYNLNDFVRVNQYIEGGKDPSGRNEGAYGGRRLPSILGLGFPGVGGERLQLGGPVWSLDQKISKILGPHAIKFGASYTDRGPGRTDVEVPNISYASVADLLANIPNNVRVTWGVNPSKSKMYSLGTFIQDDWRASPKLTLNLGIRYDYFSAYVAKGKSDLPAGLFNLDGLLDQNNFVFGPLRDANRPIEPDKMNLGPRFGFAYNPDGRGHTAIRGGFGTMFTSLSPSLFANSVANVPTLPYRADFSRIESIALGFRYPVFNEDAEKIILARNRISVTDIYPPNFQAPYTMNMHFGIERELTSTMALESAFVGTRGVKFTLVRFYNQIDRATGLRPNRNMEEGQYIDNSQQTVYTSWQTSLRKRFSKSLSWNVHYTWGKGLSYQGGDNNAFFAGETDRTSIQYFPDVKSNRGPNIGDRTHSVGADWLYQLPTIGGTNAGLRHIFGGWQVTGIFRAETGTAFNVTQRSPGGPPSRPDIIDFGGAINENWRDTGTKQYLNPAAFARVPVSAVSRVPVRPGNAGWNALRGPGRWNVDASVGKNFKLAEKATLQFRVDMFNSLNHTNYSNPSVDIDNAATFGKIFTTGGARTIQANGRLSF
jgi:hypothetical protein